MTTEQLIAFIRKNIARIAEAPSQEAVWGVRSFAAGMIQIVHLQGVVDFDTIRILEVENEAAYEARAQELRKIEGKLLALFPMIV